MSLAAMQAALGARIRNIDSDLQDLTTNELARIDRIVASPGFQLTANIQRSWCESRAATVARQTLAAVSPDVREQMLHEWTAQGGGTSSFVESEADAFLEFIARRLPEPSHVLTLCRLEQAAYRAASMADACAPIPRSALARSKTLIKRSAHATLVPFYVEPARLFDALQDNAAIARDAAPVCHLLFAPGIPGVVRRASENEIALWFALTAPMQALGRRHLLLAAMTSLAAANAIEVDARN